MIYEELKIPKKLNRYNLVSILLDGKSKNKNDDEKNINPNSAQLTPNIFDALLFKTA